MRTRAWRLALLFILLASGAGAAWSGWSTSRQFAELDHRQRELSDRIDRLLASLDEVTAAELRETFLALARECGSTAILITHQLEEAIGVGDRIVVFGKSAKLLADIHVAQWPKSRYPVTRDADSRVASCSAVHPSRERRRCGVVRLEHVASVR